MLFITLGTFKLFRIPRIPVLTFIEEWLTLPDLLHDKQRLSHHVVQVLGFVSTASRVGLAGVANSVHVGGLRIGASTNTEEITAFQNL
ncbi:hypothetical protein FQZ97_1259400 [compost metagenome]